MSVIRAKNNYIGVNGCKRLNCAQSVISAFKEKFNLQDDSVDLFKAYDGGRAPDGICGAYYAVKYIVDKLDKEKVEELEQYFLDQAGALTCIEIKSLNKLSCVGCVEKSSEFLERFSNI